MPARYARFFLRLSKSSLDNARVTLVTGPLFGCGKTVLNLYRKETSD